MSEGGGAEGLEWVGVGQYVGQCEEKRREGSFRLGCHQEHGGKHSERECCRSRRTRKGSSQMALLRYRVLDAVQSGRNLRIEQAINILTPNPLHALLLDPIHPHHPTAGPALIAQHVPDPPPLHPLHPLAPLAHPSPLKETHPIPHETARQLHKVR